MPTCVDHCDGGVFCGMGVFTDPRNEARAGFLERRIGRKDIAVLDVEKFVGHSFLVSHGRQTIAQFASKRSGRPQTV